MYYATKCAARSTATAAAASAPTEKWVTGVTYVSIGNQVAPHSVSVMPIFCQAKALDSRRETNGYQHFPTRACRP